MAGEWRKLSGSVLSVKIIQAIKSRRMTMVGHVARMRERKSAYRVLVGSLRERDHLGDPEVDGSVILKWVFKKWGGAHELD